MILALFLAPMVATVVALLALVPLLVSRAWARAEAPMQSDPMPGWALALDHELEAYEWIEVIDTLWEEDEDAPSTVRSPVWVPEDVRLEIGHLACELHASVAALEVSPATLRMRQVCHAA